MWRFLVAVVVACVIGVGMLVFPKGTTAKCEPCGEGKTHNHGDQGWRRKPPPPVHRRHLPNRLERLALLREKAAQIALHYLGTPYRWGGDSPGGFDCSGLVQYAMGRVGIHVPHSSWAQMHLGVSVQRWQIKAGDVVFFNYGGHVALALNNSRYIESPHSGSFVRTRSLSQRRLYQARRFTQRT